MNENKSTDGCGVVKGEGQKISSGLGKTKILDQEFAGAQKHFHLSNQISDSKIVPYL